MSGNTCAFAELALPTQVYERAVRYVCTERVYYYLFAHYYRFGSYPLVYLDRCLGWVHSSGPAPLLSRHNGFGRLLDRHARRTVRVPPEELGWYLGAVFADGARACVAMRWTLPDGFTAVTSVLLDGMDDEVVYFTKINETRNRICSPLPLDELLSAIPREEDGSVEVVRIAPSGRLRQIFDASPRTAFRALFDEYDFRWTADDPVGLLHAGEPVRPDLSGFDELVAYLDGAEHEIIVAGSVPRLRQFRLSKSVHSSIAPMQHFMEYVLDTEELARLLPAPVTVRAREAVAGVDLACRDVHKFASLLVQIPRSGTYRMYVEAVRRLRATQPEYQRVNLDVLRCLEQAL